jgi:hypothetical protein
MLESVLAICVSLATLITSVGLGVRWLVKHYFDEIKKEIKPNSGSSIKDQVTRLESRTEVVEEKLDRLYDLLVTQGVRTISSRTKKSETEK